MDIGDAPFRLSLLHSFSSSAFICGLNVFSFSYSRRFAACLAVGLAKADPFAVDALVCGSLNELVPF